MGGAFNNTAMESINHDFSFRFPLPPTICSLTIVDNVVKTKERERERGKGGGGGGKSSQKLHARFHSHTMAFPLASSHGKASNTWRIFLAVSFQSNGRRCRQDDDNDDNDNEDDDDNDYDYVDDDDDDDDAEEGEEEGGGGGEGKDCSVLLSR